MAEKKLTFSLTPKQARHLWAIIDGASDAGSCADGLSKAGHAACWAFLNQYYEHLRRAKGTSNGNA